MFDIQIFLYICLMITILIIGILLTGLWLWKRFLDNLPFN